MVIHDHVLLPKYLVFTVRCYMSCLVDHDLICLSIKVLQWQVRCMNVYKLHSTSNEADFNGCLKQRQNTV